MKNIYRKIYIILYKKWKKIKYQKEMRISIIG